MRYGDYDREEDSYRRDMEAGRGDDRLMRILVELYSEREINMPARDFIAQLNALYLGIPDDAKSTAVVEMEDDYDTGSGPLTLSYVRIEKPDEYKQRMANQKRRLQRERDEEEDGARMQYEQLKRRFGD